MNSELYFYEAEAFELCILLLRVEQGIPVCAICRADIEEQNNPIHSRATQTILGHYCSIEWKPRSYRPFVVDQHHAFICTYKSRKYILY